MPWNWNGTVEERFWRYVYKTWNCWFWIGSSTKKGYGVIADNGRQVGAHTVSYKIHYGEYAKGLCVLHSCDNPQCVNPAHLRIGTYSDNLLDRQRAGTDVNQNTSKTHCKNGHELIIVDSKNFVRGCPTCRNEARKRWRILQEFA